MKRKRQLSASMTVTQFDNGYWYAPELKAFAKTLKTLDAPKTYRAWVNSRLRTQT